MDDEAPTNGSKRETGIQRVFSDALLRAAAPAATLIGVAEGMPLLGGLAGLTAALVWLGRDGARVAWSGRARKAIQRAARNPDTIDHYREQLRAGGAHELRRELLEMLRDLEAAVADEAEEPLLRLFERRASGRASWDEVRAAAVLLRRLSNREVAALRALTKAVAELGDASITHTCNVEGTIVTIVRSEGKRIALPQPPGMPTLIDQLVDRHFVQQGVWASPDREGARSLVFPRSKATFLHGLLQRQ